MQKKYRLKITVFQLLVSLSCFLSVSLNGQQAVKLQYFDSSPESIEQKVAEVLATESITDEQKKTVKKLAKEAEENLRTIDEWKEAIKKYQHTANTADQMISSFKTEKPKVSPVNPDALSANSLEEKLLQYGTELELAEQRLSELNSKTNGRIKRRNEIPKLVVTAKDKLNKLQADLAEVMKKENKDGVDTIRIIALRTGIAALEYETQACREELRMFSATTNLIPLQQDFYSEKVSLLKKTVDALKKEVLQKRAEEAKAIANKVDNRGSSQPAIKKLVDQNQELATELTGQNGYTEKLRKLTVANDKTIQKVKDIKQLFADIRTKVEVTGMTPALGLYMRNKKEMFDLSDVYLQDKREVMSEVQVRLLQLEEERTKLSDIEGEINRIINEYGNQIHDGDKAHLRKTIHDILKVRLELLDKLIQTLNLYFIQLVECDTYQHLLVSTVENFQSFVNENVLWYRSEPKIGLEDVRRTWVFLEHLFKPRQWLSTAYALYRDTVNETLVYCLFLLLVIIAFRSRNYCIATVDNLANKVKRYESDRLSYTFEGVLFSLLSVVSYPLIFFFFGWRLQKVDDGSFFANGLAHGLLLSGSLYLVLRIVEVFCRSDGVGDVHFRWHADSLALIRRHLRWFIPTITVLIFISMLVTGFSMNNLVNGKSFYRFLFAIRMCVCSVFIFQVVNPKRGPVSRFLAKEKGTLFEKLRYLWYAPSVIYLLLAVLALYGYFYTAQQFNLRLQKTWLVFFITSFLYAMTVRILSLLTNKLAIAKARQKEEAKNASLAESGDGAEQTTVVQSSEETIYSMGQDTKRIIGALISVLVLLSLWFIWNDLFPALNMFDRIHLWSITQSVTEHVGDGGQGAVQTTQKVIPVTLADLMLAVIVISMTIVIIRNISGIVQILILQHMSLDEGTRFAIVTITRYAICIFGVLFTCSFLGITWSKVQWLVAAITVGLGFGLQEIFANFISGLIILLEQPIRVGDVVTVGDVTGTVTLIKIRATTILDWDKREMIVPNKEFITTKLINWSLTDKMTRLTITVGIAYGSDTAKAEEILYKVAKETPDILDDPPPTVLFNEFGDSSLTFKLRVFISSFDYYFKVIHTLHMDIDQAFRAADIEIAFPQRDIHIRSIEAPIQVSGK